MKIFSKSLSHCSHRLGMYGRSSISTISSVAGEAMYSSYTKNFKTLESITCWAAASRSEPVILYNLMLPDSTASATGPVKVVLSRTTRCSTPLDHNARSG